MAEHSSYLIPAAIAVFFIWRFFRARSVKPRVAERIKEGALIIDVRSPAEFAAGSNKGSLNIPLNELEARLSNLDHHKPIVVCCASGIRSAKAARLLREHGFDQVTDAGPWGNAAQG